MFRKCSILFFSFVAMTSIHASHHADIVEAQHIPSENFDQADVYMNLHQVFTHIDLSRKDEFWTHLRSTGKYETLKSLNISCFFDYLSADHNPSPDPYGLSQMAYHLTVLTILGPKISQILIDSNYAWVLDDDKHYDNVYSIFCDPSFVVVRQEIFDSMKSTGFVFSAIENLEAFQYNPDTVLLDKLYDSQHPVTIVIGGNRLSKKHSTYNNYSNPALNRIARSAYGSNSYAISFDDSVVTISADHRDRPNICTNALSAQLWESVVWDKIDSIWIDDYSDLCNQFKSIIPTVHHGKIQIMH